MLDLDKRIANMWVELAWNLAGRGFTVVKTQNVPDGKIRIFKDKYGNTITVKLEVKDGTKTK